MWAARKTSRQRRAAARARNVHMPGAKEFRDPAQIFAKFV
jgi:hypothetical protein